jgi:hypothetical protein
MWLALVLSDVAAARDCAHRLTLAPMAVQGLPAWTAPPVPFGASLRLDGVVICPAPDSEAAITPGTVALHVDLAYAPVWVYHAGSYPSLRQQVGLHVEPWALTSGRLQGAYFGVRLAVAQWFLRPTWHRALPSAVVGYRVESGRGTLQIGAGIVSRGEEGLFPILELRGGVLLGGR